MRSFQKFDLMQSRPAIVMQAKKYCYASNSSQIIADMTSAIANAPFSTTAQAAANAAAGPIMDLAGAMGLVKLKAQEMAELLSYILQGTAVQGSLTAPSGGPITTGADNATYNLLVGIYQILK